MAEIFGRLMVYSGGRFINGLIVGDVTGKMTEIEFKKNKERYILGFCLSLIEYFLVFVFFK